MFAKGSPVVSPLHGKGKVVDRYDDGYNRFPVVVKFEDGETFSFTKEGRVSILGKSTGDIVEVEKCA